MEIKLNEGCVLVNNRIISSDIKTIEFLRVNNFKERKPRIQHEYKHLKKSAKLEWSGSKKYQPLRNDFLSAIASFKGQSIKMNLKFNLVPNT